MFSRLLSSTLRVGITNFNVNAGTQKRNFRLVPCWTAATKNPPPPPPPVKTEITPSVNITPKRAPSAYNLFVAEKFKDVHASKPGLKMTEISKLLAAEWKKMSDEKKQPFTQESARLQHEIDDAFLRMPLNEFRKMVAKEVERLQAKRRRALRRHQQDLKEMYEYPEGDIGMFRLTAMAEDHEGELEWKKGQPVTARAKEIGKLWRSMDSEDKKKYIQREKVARSKYRRAVDAWENKMEKDGLGGVVELINMRQMRQGKVRVLGGRGGGRRRSRVLASKVAVKKTPLAPRRKIKKAAKPTETKEK